MSIQPDALAHIVALSRGLPHYTHLVGQRSAKAALERESLTEQEAFARLRKASQVSGRPMKVVAEAVVATFDRSP